MKLIKYTLAATAFFIACQVNAELPVKFQLATDLYYYDMQETTSNPGYIEIGDYSGVLYGFTLRLTPTDTSSPWSGEVSFRTGELDGDYRDSTSGVMTEGNVNVDRYDYEMAINYHLTQNVFVQAGYYFVNADATTNGTNGSVYRTDSEQEMHLFPLGVGFGVTEKVGDFYLTPKASIAYLLGTIDEDVDYKTAGTSTSASDTLYGYEVEVTVIVDRPLSDSSSIFGEIGYRVQDFAGDSYENKIDGIYGRFGYRWSF